MKKKLIALAVAATLIIPAASVYAKTSTHSGSAQISNSKISPLTVENVGGGVWDYGYTGTRIYSDYYHAGAVHSAAVCNWNNSIVSSGWINPGTDAYANCESSLWGNQAFWNTK